MIGKIVAICLTMLAPGSALAGDGKATFAKLATLVGDWTTDPSKARALHVSFRMTAADTVLVERWKTASGRESMTLYHMDGQRILVTHYCPIGNQPRLVLDVDTPVDRPSFSFLDATGLDDDHESHLSKLWLQRDGDRLRRGETYVENDKKEDSVLMLFRLAPTKS